MADITKKHEMPVLDACSRAKIFDEVALGYDKETAIEEAKRCLNCKNHPCVSGCPVHIFIPEFIKKVAEGDFYGAYEVITKDSSLPAICGRVCPQETQCESKCVRGIKGESVAIGRLERFVADFVRKNPIAKIAEKENSVTQKGKKIAVIGSGPSGLACAASLADKGFSVTVFEALHVAGGVLSYGIPEFRLPKSIVKSEIENLKKKGVEFCFDTVIGKTLTISELFEEEGFEAVFIGSGAGLPKFMSVPGENLKGVYSANEFLTRINLMGGYKENSDTPVPHPDTTLVFGGGNVAMDAARCALRLGSKVKIVYRRTENELPARKEEIEHAKEEGIEFLFLTAPDEIIGDEDGNVVKVKCARMKLGEKDSSGRARPVRVENGEFFVDADAVVIAVGTSPNPLIRSTTDGLLTNQKGGIITDESGKTSLDGVFAGGDAVTGAATVILAMGAGKTAAESICEYLKNK